MQVQGILEEVLIKSVEVSRNPRKSEKVRERPKKFEDRWESPKKFEDRWESPAVFIKEFIGTIFSSYSCYLLVSLGLFWYWKNSYHFFCSKNCAVKFRCKIGTISFIDIVLSCHHLRLFPSPKCFFSVLLNKIQLKK